MTEAGHDREGAHVDDQVLVTESRASVGLPDLGGLGAFELIDHEAHLERRKELALLHVHDLAGLGGRDEEVRLAAHERRDLQDIDDLADGLALLGAMDVGEDVESVVLLHHREEVEASLHAGTTVAAERGAVGFVVRALEDDVQLRVAGGQGLELRGDGPAVGLRFEGARSGDEEQTALIVQHAAR